MERREEEEEDKRMMVRKMRIQRRRRPAVEKGFPNLDETQAALGQ